MTDRVMSFEGRSSADVAEWLDTARGVPIMRVIRQAGARARAERSGDTTYVLAVPVELEALITRLIDARLATREPPRTRGCARFAGWQLNLIDRRLIAPGGGVAYLPGLEFALLKAFVEHAGRTISRGELATLMTQDGKARLSGRTVDSYVSRLRRRLRRGGATSIISTVHGAGYLFNTDVMRR